MKTKFPEKIYDLEDASLARSAIEKGYRHRLRVDGSPDFKEKTRRALSLVKTGGYYDMLRAYVKRIVEVDGFSQLREVDSEIWANKYTVRDPIEAAGFLVQKAWQMRMHLHGKQYYTNIGERNAVNKRLEFLEALAGNSRDAAVREECKRKLRLWDESKFL